MPRSNLPKKADNQPPANSSVKVALIGGVAVVAAALIGIVPTVASWFSPAQSVSAPSSSGIVATQVSNPAVALATATPQETATRLPTPTSTSVPVSGLMFATKIAPNGEAIDPGTSFPPDIQDIYAVFRADMTPPGLVVDAQNPKPDAYYAYLKLKEGTKDSTVGWRWYLDGQLVNEYETGIQSGASIWLQRFDYSEGGIFGSGSLTPGNYRVVFLLGGNSALSSDLIIAPLSDAP
jgi:hypothetical protein